MTYREILDPATAGSVSVEDAMIAARPVPGRSRSVPSGRYVARAKSSSAVKGAGKPTKRTSAARAKGHPVRATKAAQK